MEHIFGSHPEAHTSCHKCIVGCAEQLVGMSTWNTDALTSTSDSLFSFLPERLIANIHLIQPQVLFYYHERNLERAFSGCLYTNVHGCCFETYRWLYHKQSFMCWHLWYLFHSVSVRGHKNICSTSCQGAVISEPWPPLGSSVSVEVWLSVHRVQYTDRLWNGILGIQSENKTDHLK